MNASTALNRLFLSTRPFQAGRALSRELPNAQPGAHAGDAFLLRLPRPSGTGAAWSFDQVAALTNMPIMIQCRDHPLQLNGEFVLTRCDQFVLQGATSLY